MGPLPLLGGVALPPATARDASGSSGADIPPVVGDSEAFALLGPVGIDHHPTTT
jgi:hypothetical protein